MTSVHKPGFSQPTILCPSVSGPHPCSPGEAARRVHLCSRSPHQASHQQPSPDVKLGVGKLQTQTNKSAPDHKWSRAQGGWGERDTAGNSGFPPFPGSTGALDSRPDNRLQMGGSNPNGISLGMADGCECPLGLAQQWVQETLPRITATLVNFLCATSTPIRYHHAF